jgi:hypothetical protein
LRRLQHKTTDTGNRRKERWAHTCGVNQDAAGKQTQKTTEKDLDKEIEAAFKNSPEFANWFVSKTKFNSRNTVSRCSRSDHPWGVISLTVLDQETGESHQITKGSETDILVILEDSEKHTIALHIESKLRGGRFTSLQPELYRARAQQWMHNPKYHSYTEYATVLVAPQEFFDHNKNECNKFDRFISQHKTFLFRPAICGDTLDRRSARRHKDH